MPDVSPGAEHRAIAALVAPLITAGARLPVGPSPVITALLREMAAPVRIDSGLLPEAVLHPVEYTHDLGRLSADPLFAVNIAVEIDLDGQVNVDGTAASVLGGIGGHADYAAAAARSAGGLSTFPARRAAVTA